MLAGKYQRRPTDHRGLQHRVRLSVGGVKLRWLVAPAGLQRLPQDVLLGYAREGDRVLEDVHPKAGVKLLHLLESFQKGGDFQVVVVLQPVAEGPHATLTEDAVAVVVLRQRENVLTLELGIPGQVGWKTGEVQLVRAVEPLVREPGLGQGGAAGLDPLVVRDARGQVVQHVQELEPGGVYEHDATVLLRSEGILVLGHERDEVLADELEVVVARVEAQHRHLVEPLQDLLALRLGDAVDVGKAELVYHVRYDCLVAPLQGLVEEVDQLVRVPGDDVLRLWVQRVRNGYGDGHVLALVEEVGGGSFRLAYVLIRLEVVNDRVGVSRRLPLGTAGGFPGGGLFVFPLLDHRVTRVSQELGSHQGETVGVLPLHGLALAVPPYDQLALFVQLRHGSTSSFGIALLATVPEATVVLEDGLCLGVITVHPSAQNVPLAPMATTSVMGMNAPPLCLPFKPFCSDEAATSLGVEGFLVG